MIWGEGSALLASLGRILNRRSYLSLVGGDPISRDVPLMTLDVVDAIFKVAKAFGEIHLQ